jgi:phage terminase large subunit
MTNSEFTYKPTTALYKIKNLLRNNEKTFVIQGGQGAGKTISILMILIDYCYRNEKKEVSIISDELAKMKRTVVLDFQKIMRDWNMFNSIGTWNKSESKYYFDNGSFIEFLGLDLHDVGKGMRRDIVYTNEANKVKQESYRQVASRANLSIIDFNPDGYFWGTDLIDENNFIQLTFKDNEYLGQGEVDSILDYFNKGYYPDGTLRNEYWANVWRVYGLGEVGSVEGRVFTHFKQNTFRDFIQLNLPEFYGIDWGKNHAFSVIQYKYDQYTNTLYCHELNGKSENQLLQDLTPEQRAIITNDNGGIIIYTLTRLGVPKNKTIVCDSARPDNIFMLQDFGWNHAIGIDKPKGSVMVGIGLVQDTNIIYTIESKGIDSDFKNYQYAKDRLGVVDDEVVKLNDDFADNIRYVRRHIRNIGLG